MPRRATPIFRRCGSRRSRLRRACPAPCGAGGGNSAPGTPRLNGKVERSHRIDAEEFYRMLDGVVVDDAKLFTTKLQEWEDFYNFERPHGALQGQTPYERLRSKMSESGVSGHRQLHTIRATESMAGHAALDPSPRPVLLRASRSRSRLRRPRLREIVPDGGLHDRLERLFIELLVL